MKSARQKVSISDVVHFPISSKIPFKGTESLIKRKIIIGISLLLSTLLVFTIFWFQNIDYRENDIYHEPVPVREPQFFVRQLKGAWKVLGMFDLTQNLNDTLCVQYEANLQLMDQQITLVLSQSVKGESEPQRKVSTYYFTDITSTTLQNINGKSGQDLIIIGSFDTAKVLLSRDMSFGFILVGDENKLNLLHTILLQNFVKTHLKFFDYDCHSHLLTESNFDDSHLLGSWNAQLIFSPATNIRLPCSELVIARENNYYLIEQHLTSAEKNRGKYFQCSTDKRLFINANNEDVLPHSFAIPFITDNILILMDDFRKETKGIIALYSKETNQENTKFLKEENIKIFKEVISREFYRNIHKDQLHEIHSCLL